MKSTSRFTRLLRGAAITSLLVGLGVWAATGAHFGWTQTSAVQMQRDEITGIDYPVRQSAFVAGLEIPLLAGATAAALAAVSFVPRRMRGAFSFSNTTQQHS